MSRLNVTTLARAGGREGDSHRTSIRGLVTLGALTAVVYVVLCTGMAAGCTGGYDSSGGYIDAEGRPTTIEPLCATFRFEPRLYVVALIAGLVAAAAVAMTRVATNGEARRIRGQAVIAVLVVGLLFTSLHSILGRIGILDAWMSEGRIATVPFDNLEVEFGPLPWSERPLG
ncbi:MAG: hypothetical protein RI885_457 [Actinomycetota bacterium]|jgi:hypothetical protein